MARGLFIGIVQGASAAAAAQWRDATLAPAAIQGTGLRAVARYTPFNLPQALLYIDCDDIGEPPVGALPKPDAGTSLVIYRARQVSEMRQRASTDDPMACPILYTVRFAVPHAVQADFDDWYESEHIPMALGSPLWTMTRRYRFESDEPTFTHLAVHHLADVRALQSPQMKAARLTPWRAKFAKEAWFQGSERIIALQDQ